MRVARTKSSLVATWASVALSVVLIVGVGEESLHAGPPLSDPEVARDDLLSMSPGIVCREIEGYEKYEEMPDSALTSDEKLLIYYRPHRYAVDRGGDSYHIHLSQEGQLRKKGEKAILFRKDKLVDYEWKGTKTPGPLYLKNTIAIKGLKPGDYEFDITLHDKLSKDPAATQTVSFKIIPAVMPDQKAEEKPDAGSRVSKKQARRVAPPRHETSRMSP